MVLNLDPIYLMNLTMCIIIAGLGYRNWSSGNRKSRMPLFIAIAFAGYGISHLAFVLGLKDSLEFALLAVRTLAYLTVIYALYDAMKAR